MSIFLSLYIYAHTHLIGSIFLWRTVPHTVCMDTEAIFLDFYALLNSVFFACLYTYQYKVKIHDKTAEGMNRHSILISVFKKDLNFAFPYHVLK